MRRTLPGLLALAALIASACSLITRFDDGTQACDEQAPANEECLPGYTCVGGHCVAGDSGVLSIDSGAVFDAGTGDGGVHDAGTGDAGLSDAGSSDGGVKDGGSSDGGDGGH